MQTNCKVTGNDQNQPNVTFDSIAMIGKQLQVPNIRYHSKPKNSKARAQVRRRFSKHCKHTTNSNINANKKYLWPRKETTNVRFQHKLKTEARKKLFSLPLPTEAVRISRNSLPDEREPLKNVMIRKFFSALLKSFCDWFKRSCWHKFLWFWCWGPREFFSAITFHQHFGIRGCGRRENV